MDGNVADSPFIGRTFQTPLNRCVFMVRTARRRFVPHARIRITDIGCGTGNQIFELSKAFPYADCIGVDISQENIAAAERRRKTEYRGKRIRFQAADYMSFNDAPSNLIISDSTLHNIDTPPDQLFLKITNDLTDGGVLIITTPYECVYNRLLWAARRILKALPRAVTNRLVLVVGQRIYGKRFSLEMLRERVPYMYMIPNFCSKPNLHRRLAVCFNLFLVQERRVAHAGVGHPKHKLLVFEKQKTL